ncbi:MAG: hypothetical protein KGH66_02155, partial [Candidatus Micrarchaeota archaeon]|nr:hypothetical protein [Candidatus Micrarchaeota archaeon]
AIPGKTVSNDQVTASLGSSTTYLATFVIAVQNLNSWDSNPSLPAHASSGSTTVGVSYSTTNPKDFVFAAGTGCNGDGGQSWTGLTPLDGAASEFADAYAITSSAQSGASATFGFGSSFVGIVLGAASST